MISEIKNEIEKIITEPIDIDVIASEKEEFGHYSTNVAFKITPQLKKSPLEVAQELARKFEVGGSNFFYKIEVAPPGFINFWINSEILHKELKEILRKKSKYGSSVVGRRSSVNLEFISANPTGPLTMANGRGGFYGDVLANVLEKTGNKVVREYYINDAGNQVKLLGESILAELGLIPGAENHYKGGYIKDLAKKLKSEAKKNDALKLGQLAAKILLIEIKKSLKAAGIAYDVWFSEDKNLIKKKESEKLFKLLQSKNLIEEKGGALWLGDNVLIKSDKQSTYFLSDLAYHYDKFLKRKFDLAIDIWGADHHGYIARMKNGINAIGVNPDRLKIIISQLVRLISAGKELKMSKRTGIFITMDELLEEVGVDAARFFFLMHSLDTHMDFDMDLAKEKSQKNPVYYAQYALVRCINILQKSKVATANAGQESRKSKVDFSLLKSDSEINLILELIKFPDLLIQIAGDYQVQRLTKYATDLARALHNFYEKERVVGVGGHLETARLSLVLGCKTVLSNLFDILGISKPSKM